MTRDTELEGTVAVAVSALTAAMVVLPPAIYFLVSYNYTAGILEAEAEINSRIVTRIVGANPELWEYEKIRVSEYLSRRPRPKDAERRRVLNARGAVVAESADPLPAPCMTRSVPLFDAGARVGTIEVSRSLRPLLFRSGLLLLALLSAGVLSFRLVLTLPMRAVRRSEQALRHERDTAQKYLDVAGVAFAIVDLTGRVTLVNRAGGEILGRSEREILGHDIAILLEPADRARVASELAASRPERVAALECAVLRPTGERRVVSCYLTPISDDAGRRTAFLVSGIDITVQRELEAKLLKAQQLEAIGRLAGGVAHDFNNVLSVIKGNAVLLRRRTGEADPQLRWVDAILAAVQRGASLTSSLLTLGRRQVLHAGPVDLVELVRRFEHSLRSLVREDVELCSALPAEALPVMADAPQIERVLMNLVTNAQDAMPEGGRILIAASRASLDAEAAVRAGLETPGPCAQLSVTDSGTGIGAEAQAHVFEPLFTTKEAGKGTGLGLSIAYAIMKQHRGAIRVASEPGKGATFTLLLPLLDPSAELAAERGAHGAPPSGGP